MLHAACTCFALSLPSLPAAADFPRDELQDERNAIDHDAGDGFATPRGIAAFAMPAAAATTSRR